MIAIKTNGRRGPLDQAGLLLQSTPRTSEAGCPGAFLVVFSPERFFYREGFFVFPVFLVFPDGETEDGLVCRGGPEDYAWRQIDPS